MRSRVVLPLALVLTTLAAPGVAGAAPTVTEYDATAGATPGAIARGVDGNVWFASAADPAKVGRITPGGTAQTFTSGLPHDSVPRGITAGPSGSMWVGESAKDKIVRVTPASGAMSELGSGGKANAMDVVAGPDGNLWATATDGSRGAIVRMTPSGTKTQYTAGLATDPDLGGIALGPDGNLWFTLTNSRRIGRITTQGTLTIFGPAGIPGTPLDITEGPDGNLWFTQTGTPAIGRITPAGAIQSFTAGLPAGSAPRRITAGADGNVYFTDRGGNAIGQVTPAGVISTYVTLPGANDGLDGITTGADGKLWFAEETAGKIGVVPVAPTSGALTASAVTDTAATVSGTVTPHGEATDWVIEWGTDLTYADGATSPTSVGSGTTGQTATTGLTGLLPNTTYHARLRATSASGTTMGPDLTFTTTAAGAPSATSQAAIGVDATSATLKGSVNPQGNATTYQFVWGPADDPTANSTPGTPGLVGSVAGEYVVTESLTGLEPNTTYVFHVVAAGNGTTTGADETFTTDALPPDATTDPADGITRTGATLNATIDPQNSATTYAFEWGTSTTYDNRSPALDAELGVVDHTPHQVAEPLTGLTAGATYHFRVVGTSDAGVTAGPDQTFTTDPAGLPDATTLAATGVSASAATVNATVNPQDGPTTYQFVWGTLGDPAAHSAPASPAAVGSDATAHAVSEPLTGLEPNTTYAFRVVATGNGTATGAVSTFTTGALAPDAATDPADAITRTGATLHATIDPQNSATTYAFEWGSTAAYGTRAPSVDAPVGSDHTGHAVEQALAGLTAGAAYHFRVVATSAAGTTIGTDQTFTTAAPAAPEAPAASDPPSPPPGVTPEPLEPALGRTAVASVLSGTIRFRAPGSTELVEVHGDAQIPTGSVIDTRDGTLALESALDATGRTQTARFRRGAFRVGLSRDGMVDITLTDRPTGCGRGAALRAAKKAKAPIKLWSSDSKGKYRTHGRNSVAVVRGTEWTTTETCAGTLTRVVKGSVQVKDARTRRTVLVRAGHTHLARPAR